MKKIALKNLQISLKANIGLPWPMPFFEIKYSPKGL
jgi:hypothetical protein